MQNTLLSNIFTDFQDHFNSEQEVRENIRTVVKEIERVSREILTSLQVIHQDTGLQEIPNACFKARTLLTEVGEYYTQLQAAVPKGQYYRYHDHWRFVTQRLCFLIALTVYLEMGFLVSRETAAEILHMSAKQQGEVTFHLDLEDYLMGLLQLSSELSRFAVNSVTNGDYNRPLEIARFVGELNAGFRLLNLKNDSLRKRFDALKYDVKKIEEVVYDLSIRGLKPGVAPVEDSPDGGATGTE